MDVVDLQRLARRADRRAMKAAARARRAGLARYLDTFEDVIDARYASREVFRPGACLNVVVEQAELAARYASRAARQSAGLEGE